MPCVTPGTGFSVDLCFRGSSEDSGTGTFVPDLVQDICEKVVKGELQSGWNRFPLSENEHRELVDKLSKRKPNARLDRFSTQGVTVVRMASDVHEIVNCEVDDLIKAQIREIGQSKKEPDKWAELARKIRFVASATIKLLQFGTHAPDSSYKFENAAYPSVVMEVCFTQFEGGMADFEMEDMANDYIQGSNGEINTVIFLKVPPGYSRNKNNKLAIYRRDFSDTEGLSAKEVMNKVFRDDNGNVDTEAKLELPLEDFIPIYERPNEASGYAITISAEVLSNIVSLGRAHILAEKRRGLEILPLKPRPSRPVQEVTGSRETQFQTGEQKALARAESADSDYEPNE